MTEEFDEDVVFEVCIYSRRCLLSKLVSDALSYLASSEVNIDVGSPIH